MNPLNLRSIDLNLLPVLLALLEERSVTLASSRVNLSQSATSSALQRLRETFDDPIVVRRGQRMVPSARALLIRNDLKDALENIRTIIASLKNDEATGTHRVLALSAPEHVHLTLSEVIRALVNNEDSQMSVHISSIDRRSMTDQLQKGAIDLAIGAFGGLAKQFNRLPLYEESMNVIMSKDHPLMTNSDNDRLTISDLSKYPHLVVSHSENIEASFLSRWLLSKSVVRKVGVVVEHVSLVPEMLRNTDLICLGTERSLNLVPSGRKLLSSKKLPAELGDDSYTIEMIWHDRTQNDVVLQSAREAIYSFCQTIQTEQKQ